MPVQAAREAPLAKRPSLEVVADLEGVEAATAYTDGSVFDESDPVLARAGWAAVLVDAQARTLRAHSAGVDGAANGAAGRAASCAVGVGGDRGSAPCDHRV